MEDALPPDVLRHVASFLDGASLAALSAASHRTATAAAGAVQGRCAAWDALAIRHPALWHHLLTTHAAAAGNRAGVCLGAGGVAALCEAWRLPPGRPFAVFGRASHTLRADVHSMYTRQRTMFSGDTRTSFAEGLCGVLSAADNVPFCKRSASVRNLPEYRYTAVLRRGEAVVVTLPWQSLNSHVRAYARLDPGDVRYAWSNGRLQVQVTLPSANPADSDGHRCVLSAPGDDSLTYACVRVCFSLPADACRTGEDACRTGAHVLRLTVTGGDDPLPLLYFGMQNHPQVRRAIVVFASQYGLPVNVLEVDRTTILPAPQ